MGMYGVIKKCILYLSKSTVFKEQFKVNLKLKVFEYRVKINLDFDCKSDNAMYRIKWSKDLFSV